jgi:hypothetical protein
MPHGSSNNHEIERWTVYEKVTVLVVLAASSAALFSAEHVHSTTEVHLLLFLLFGFLFRSGGTASIGGTSFASPSTSSPAGGRDCDDLRQLLGVA